MARERQDMGSAMVSQRSSTDCSLGGVPSQIPQGDVVAWPTERTFHFSRNGSTTRHIVEQRPKLLLCPPNPGFSSRASRSFGKMRAELALSSDPDVRRAAAMMEGAKAEREARATIPKEARPGADPAVRLRELEFLSRHDHVRYTIEGKAEHEALLAKQAEAGPQPVRVLNTEDSLASIRATEGGAALASEWGDEAPAKVQAVQQSTLEMLNAMGDKQAQGAFMYGVSQLPGQVQTGFARELSSAAPESVTPAAADVVAEYQAYGVVEKWGAEAPMRVARAEARADRMLKDLPVENRAVALNWFRGLPANQRAAIIEQLSR